jgi:hypothetical protein
MLEKGKAVAKSGTVWVVYKLFIQEYTERTLSV